MEEVWYLYYEEEERRQGIERGVSSLRSFVIRYGCNAGVKDCGVDASESCMSDSEVTAKVLRGQGCETVGWGVIRWVKRKNG